ncbi:hypothetical protein JW905_09590 [bacterium]|nr:hypothetical protein [candidate division CSSED10-310 bacterium]
MRLKYTRHEWLHVTGRKTGMAASNPGPYLISVIPILLLIAFAAPVVCVGASGTCAPAAGLWLQAERPERMQAGLPAWPTDRGDGDRTFWEPAPTAGAEARYWHVAVARESIHYYLGGVNAQGQVTGTMLRYDPLATAWLTPGPSLPIPVCGAAVALIGNCIYVAGGFTDLDTPWSATAEIQIYDIASGVWTSGEPLPEARGGLIGGAVGGEFVVAGGSIDDGFPTSAPCYSYSPTSDAWSPRPPLPAAAGLVFGAACTHDERLYVTGDYRGYTAFYSYDLTLDTWNVLADVPAGGGQSPVLLSTPVGVFCIGGGSGYWQSFHDATLFFFTGIGSWVRHEAAISPPRCSAAGISDDGVLHLFGGSDGTVINPPAHELLTLVQGQLNMVPAESTGTGQPGGTVTHVLSLVNASTVADSYLLEYAGDWPHLGPTELGPIAAGAAEPFTVDITVPASAHAFIDSDELMVTAWPVSAPASSTQASLRTSCSAAWQRLADAPAPVRYGSAGATTGTALYIFGGTDGDTPTNELLRFNPVSGQWLTLSSLSFARSGAAAVSISSSDYLYLFGGYDGFATCSTAERYQISRNSWSALPAAMPDALANSAVASLDNVIYLFGGYTGQSATNNVLAYDLGAEEWHVHTTMPAGARHGAVAVVAGDYIYVIGGWPQLTRVERYHLPTHTWDMAAPLNIGRHSAGIITTNNRIIVFGGAQGWTPLTSSEMYDTALDLWLPGPGMTVGRYGMAAGTVASLVLAAFGGEPEPGMAVECLALAQVPSPTPAGSPVMTPTPTMTTTPPPLTCPILLLDDDGDTPDVATFYQSALALLNATDVEILSTAGSVPTLDMLALRRLVIYFSGARSAPFEQQTRELLEAYLRIGGNLVVSSQDLLNDPGWRDFTREFLHTDGFLADVPETDITGSGGSSIGGGLGPFHLQAPAGFPGIWPDRVLPGPAAEAAFDFVVNGSPNAVYFSDGQGSSLFLAWPLEAVSDILDRAMVLERIASVMCQPLPEAMFSRPPEIELWTCPETAFVTVELFNFTGIPDTFLLSYDGEWTMNGPGQIGPIPFPGSATFQVSLSPPPGPVFFTMASMHITSHAGTHPALTAATEVTAAATLYSWQEDQLPHARLDPLAGAWRNELIVTGGWNDQTRAMVRETDIYNTTTGTWRSGAPLPPPGLRAVTCTVLNGCLISPGDEQNHYLYFYDPTGDCWETEPMPEMVPSASEYALTGMQGALYRLGGRSGGLTLKSCWEYDISTGEWLRLADMTIPRRRAMAWTDGTRIFVAGGIDGAGNVLAGTEFYNPEQNAWYQDPTEFSELPEPRAAAAAAVLPWPERPFWLGGGTNGYPVGNILDSCLLYDRTDNQWLGQPPLPSRVMFAAAGAPVDFPFVMGGAVEFNPPLAGTDFFCFAHVCPNIILTPTPTATPEISPTPTHQPTPTPIPYDLGVLLIMPDTWFTTGELCWLDAILANPSDTGVNGLLLAALDVYGVYFWWPLWTEDVTYESLALPPFSVRGRNLLQEFLFPPGGGYADGLRFLAAITDTGLTRVIGEIGIWEFGFES